MGAALAIRRGLERGKGGVWIHTSGTDILLPPGPKGGLKGEKKLYDDWDGIGECLSLPGKKLNLCLCLQFQSRRMTDSLLEAHSHGPMDKVVRTSFSPKIKTAIICPPTIWGAGRGTGNTRSHEIYNLTSLTLSRGAGIKIPSPSAHKLFWPDIHIRDLANLYLQVIESAISEIDGKKGRATWNEEGYYFAENGRHYWQEVAGWIADEAAKQGLLKSGGVTELDEEDEKQLAKAGLSIYNLVSDCKAFRAEKLFGWKPKEGPLKNEIPNVVSSEAKRLGLTK